MTDWIQVLACDMQTKFVSCVLAISDMDFLIESEHCMDSRGRQHIHSYSCISSTYSFVNNRFNAPLIYISMFNWIFPNQVKRKKRTNPLPQLLNHVIKHGVSVVYNSPGVERFKEYSGIQIQI